MKKEQVVALIAPETKTRLDLLRVVMRCSRARVMEAGWQPGGLAALEEAHIEDLRTVEQLATKVGVSVTRYAQLYSGIFARETYGPELANLGTPEWIKAFRKEDKTTRAA